MQTGIKVNTTGAGECHYLRVSPYSAGDYIFVYGCKQPLDTDQSAS